MLRASIEEQLKIIFISISLILSTVWVIMFTSFQLRSSDYTQRLPCHGEETWEDKWWIWVDKCAWSQLSSKCVSIKVWCRGFAGQSISRDQALSHHRTVLQEIHYRLHRAERRAQCDCESSAVKCGLNMLFGHKLLYLPSLLDRKNH